MKKLFALISAIAMLTSSMAFAATNPFGNGGNTSTTTVSAVEHHVYTCRMTAGTSSDPYVTSWIPPKVKIVWMQDEDLPANQQWRYWVELVGQKSPVNSTHTWVENVTNGYKFKLTHEATAANGRKFQVTALITHYAQSTNKMYVEVNFKPRNKPVKAWYNCSHGIEYRVPFWK